MQAALARSSRKTPPPENNGGFSAGEGENNAAHGRGKPRRRPKGGFVAFHFLTGKDKDAIAKDLAASFKLTEPQAAKIVRRITGRVRLYGRVFELVPAKKA